VPLAQCDSPPRARMPISTMMPAPMVGHVQVLHHGVPQLLYGPPPRARTADVIPRLPQIRYGASQRARSVDIIPRRSQSSKLAGTFVFFAVANRVFNRILLVPLAQHTYFLAQVTSFAQLTGHTTVLKRRAARGFVTGSMLRFILNNMWMIGAVGVCEGLCYPLVFLGAAGLPGGTVQILNQALVPFTVLFSFLFLNRRYSIRQLSGVAFVLGGVVLAALAAAGPPGAAAVSSRTGLASMICPHSVVCVIAYALLAGSQTIKDAIFTRFKTFKESQPDDGFQELEASLLTASAAAAQVCTTLMLWPLLLLVRANGIGGWGYWLDGARRISGSVELLAPFMTFAYWSCNIGFTMSATMVVNQASAATLVLLNALVLPISALMFCCPLPLMQRQAFHWQFLLSLVLVVFGNVIYSSSPQRKTDPPKAAKDKSVLNE